MPATEQQSTIIGHDSTKHGLVIAGPGTGKSWTAIGFLSKLHEDRPELRVALLTFTRAATTELLKKVSDQGIDWFEPSTIHAFALRLLLRNAANAPISLPLRIPDTWETKNLIRDRLAKRLRQRGFNVTVKGIANLEREMGAQWEKLDPNAILFAEIHPELRNAYVGEWRVHRRMFGYLLLAEIPFRAGELIVDHDPPLDELAFLIVDEYQDLNRADIRLLESLADRGVNLLAIGDDDQSIYGFRMAAPEGITEFPETFPGTRKYPLSVSLRCGQQIIDAATSLIETAPERRRRPRLMSQEGAPPGEFAYLRFRNQNAEAKGVAELIMRRLASGVEADQIAILVRSNVEAWVKLLRPELERREIELVDDSWVDAALGDKELRKALSVARLALDKTDSLSWWSLLHLTRGVAPNFIEYVIENTATSETFGECLLRLHPEYSAAPSRTSATKATPLVSEQLLAIETLDTQGIPQDDLGWGGWLIRRVPSGSLSGDAQRLLEAVGAEVPATEGLANFLGQLEPVGKDLASEANAVRIMTMTASKGLTVNSAFLMGVEAAMIPHPKATEEEDRRLLYVAMTRATDACILTCAQRRTGPTARLGNPNVNQPRARCPLFDGLPIARWSSGEDYVNGV